MNRILIILFFFTSNSSCQKNVAGKLTATNMNKKYSYLALGDSYTIGEMVAVHDNFPNQTAKMMRTGGHDFTLERIIARTGWTTDELEAGMITSNSEKPLSYSY
ncbi:MAG: SGNH/GDSL hydrolase family protein, partial [Bacteroidota bacterium]